MQRVIVTRELPDGWQDPLRDLIADGAVEIIGPRTGDVPYSHADLCALAPTVDAIVCLLTDQIDATIVEAGAAGSLKLVANVAVGYDNVAWRRAHELGVLVSNTPGVLDDTTADTAFMLMLSACRLASVAEADLRNDRWKGWGINQYLGRDVFGATLGLVGYGRIARAMARRAQGFDMTVLHHCRTASGDEGYVADLDELIRVSDVVSLHVPGGPDTYHLIDARRLALMKPTAVLVNTARGLVVDEAALGDALHNGSIFGAGIDVFEAEPAVHPRLLSAPRAVLLPHIGSGSQSTRANMARLATGAVAAVLRGSQPSNLVPRG